MVKLAAMAPAVLLAACAAAPSTQVTVTNAWAQPLDASGTVVALYMTVTPRCSGSEAIRSVSAAPPLTASLHQSSIADNALKMTPLSSVETPCGKPTLLKPMGQHVMVSGLPRPVSIGSTIPVTLTFRDGAAVNVTAEVTTMAALANVDPMNMHGHAGHMKMDGMSMH
ncbi:copper chaperone PCu(A)C [Sphingomonas rubra]|uniref:Copper(I)-binding protein n=1 Tax=Sphingomonas rubra TaxID=634430 RepID=A0A1I5TT81_9SPHN|nr:copper chaperone PCu(A)C [Sphingomonas rubra]SFP86264.1 hypothetical protein SAMN04488241_10938 [Sphingomonas rubra]